MPAKLIHEFSNFRIIRKVPAYREGKAELILEQKDGEDSLGVPRWKVRKSEDTELLNELIVEIAVTKGRDKTPSLGSGTEFGDGR